MKTLFMSLVSILFAATAFAMPSVGDQALYNVTMSQGGQQMVGTLEQLITANNNDMYDVQMTFNFNGSSQVKNEQRDIQDLMTDGYLNDILTNCQQYGGQSGPVTVSAGTFDACALPINDNDQTGTYWLGNVAFGLLKVDMKSKDGQETHSELQSFKFGK